MEVVRTIAAFNNRLEEVKEKRRGLVPTMGALHAGHLSLVRKAVEECPLAIVTIYVNPTQFNDKEDLKRYPRTESADLALLEKELRAGDIVFIPGDREIYPTEDKRKFSFGNLDEVMEATHRPGHFNGVAQVVSRLFGIIRPHVAFFGQKDFQQVAVIRNMVRQLNLDVKIVALPIIREPDGLAMSSRNMLLEPEIRKVAPVIYRTLTEASAMFGQKEASEIAEYVISRVNSTGCLSVDYFEIVDDRDLVPLRTGRNYDVLKTYFGCIEVKAGKVRLIDNIQMGCYHQTG